MQCTYIVLQRFCLNIRAKCLYYHVVREHRGVLNCRVLVAIESHFWVLIIAFFKNTRRLKFKSCLRNCVFGSRQHNYDHKQRSYISFFFIIRTTFLFWIIGLHFCRNRNYKDQRRGRVSRFKIKVDWVRTKQNFVNTGEDYRLGERVKRFKNVLKMEDFMLMVN